MSDNDIKEWLKETTNIRAHLPSEIQVHHLLSTGGQGVVYRGLVDSVDAAIKVYLPGQVDKRVEREIQALKDLDCRTIVDLLWSGRVNIQDYEVNVVATSFVEGTPLDEVVKKGPLESLDQLGFIAYDVALAIQAMWARRIVHRDLKPSNILLRPSGRACVIDLGLARHLNDSSLTQIGATWGTFGYLSPEQTRRVRQLTCKSDVFALGIVVLEAALGRHPTRGDQLRLEAQGFHKVLPDEIADWVHADLIKRMLDPKPIRRPSPEEILEVLTDYSN
jgi:serine/threonine-protein kinase